MLNTIDTSAPVTGLSDIRQRILQRIPETKMLLDRRNQSKWDTRLEQKFEARIKQIFHSLVNSNISVNVDNLLFPQQAPEKHWWHWLEIFKGESLSIGLMGLDPKKPVPLHDHPDTHAILIIVSGTVIINQYDIRDISKCRDQILQLRQIRSREQSSGEVSIAYPHYSNIHALHCVSNSAFLLSLQFKNSQAAVAAAGKSWYFPLFPQLESQRDIWVKRLHLH